MPTVKTVEVNFTFAYVDKRHKYTSKDFGLKSIPYGESDETEADGLPAYQEELAHIEDVLCRTAEKFSLDKDCTRITKMSLSDEWISLYNRDEDDGKLDVEVEVAVNAIFELQFKKPSKNENKEANVIDDRLLCVLNEFSVLAHGHAMCNYWSYEQKATIMIQNTMQPIIVFITYLSAATLLILARLMQEEYSDGDGDGASVSHVIGSVIEILIGSDVGLLILPLFITGVANIIYLLVSPLLNV